MKRTATIVLLAVLLITGTAAGTGNRAASAQDAPTVAQVTGDEALAVSPMQGDLNTTFTVTGSGFAPGSLMDEAFVDPTGARWQFSDWNTFNVEDDGRFGFTYDLGRTDDAASLPLGRWTISYCYDGTANCSTVDLVIQ